MNLRRPRFKDFDASKNMAIRTMPPTPVSLIIIARENLADGILSGFWLMDGISRASFFTFKSIQRQHLISLKDFVSITKPAHHSVSWKLQCHMEMELISKGIHGYIETNRNRNRIGQACQERWPLRMSIIHHHMRSTVFKDHEGLH